MCFKDAKALLVLVLKKIIISDLRAKEPIYRLSHIINLTGLLCSLIALFWTDLEALIWTN